MTRKKSDHKNDEFIVVQCNAFMTDEERREIQEDLVAQAKDGIIVLPACCSLRAIVRGGINVLKEDAQ